MFYRRKIILSLIEVFGNRLEKIQLQKLLFLFSIHEKKPYYHFIPYHFGCYSISANADLRTMVSKNQLLEDNSSYSKADSFSYQTLLNPSDREKLQQLKQQYAGLNSQSLMRTIYRSYPYFAINSKSASNLLSASEINEVNKSRPGNNNTCLYTIGYEGLSIEEYLNKLIREDVKLLVDVRNNPVSMKFGFSKTTLKRFCESLGIEYIHIPEVGIKSDFRKNLSDQSSYDELFVKYNDEIITTTTDKQIYILNLLKKHKRIALTCFEAQICQCHRTHLAAAIGRLKEWKYEIVHL